MSACVSESWPCERTLKSYVNTRSCKQYAVYRKHLNCYRNEGQLKICFPKSELGTFVKLFNHYANEIVKTYSNHLPAKLVFRRRFKLFIALKSEQRLGNHGFASLATVVNVRARLFSNAQSSFEIHLMADSWSFVAIAYLTM